ncbi:MAG: FAD:protein FMN transferase [Candidatus Wallbacteria bacterium]|nr:FAD:protein FMN transferase [Candidatus Wallbacteria bacterium]
MKKIRNSLAAAIIFAGAVFLLKSASPAFHEKSGFLFNTYWEIKLSGGVESDTCLNSAIEVLTGTVSHFLMDCATSELFILNSTGRVERPSKDFSECLLLTKELHHRTGGFFDPSVCGLMEAYGFYDGNHRLPDSLEISTLIRQSTGLSLEVTDEFVRIPNTHKLDLGAIVKGFAVDRTADFLSGCGLTGFLINFGGEVRSYGKKGNHDWQIGVRHPSGNGIVSIVSGECAVATSGDYENSFEIKGQLISHILSPFDGSCSSDMESVSVYGTTCAEADALATALMIMGQSRAREFAENNGLNALLINQAGEIQRIGRQEIFSSN